MSTITKLIVFYRNCYAFLCNIRVILFDAIEHVVIFDSIFIEKNREGRGKRQMNSVGL